MYEHDYDKFFEKLIKIIHLASGQKFNGNFIEFEKWENNQDQNLPIIDSSRFSKSMSIVRYVANKTNLAGKDSLEQAQSDAIVETVLDIINYYYSKIFFIDDEDEKVVNLIFIYLKYLFLLV